MSAEQPTEFVPDPLYARHEPISDPEVPRSWDCSCGGTIGFSGNGEWLDAAFARHLMVVAARLMLRSEEQYARDEPEKASKPDARCMECGRVGPPSWADDCDHCGGPVVPNNMPDLHDGGGQS